MNGGRFLYLRCKKHTDPLSLSRKHYRLIRAVICYVLPLEFMRETLRSSKEYGRERMYIYGRYHDWVGEGFPCVSAGTDSHVSRLLEDRRLRSRLYSP